MKTEYTKFTIVGAHRLRFIAAEGKDSAILTPTSAVVKADNRIKLTAKADKLGQKASREAVRRLLDFPNHVAEPRAGAKLLALALLAQVSPLYTVQAGTALPAIQIGGALRLPESVGHVLNALQGAERWSGDGWHLKRPWILRPRLRVGAAAPEASVCRYIGGKAATFSVGKRVKFWAPYVGCATAFAPDLPVSVRREILKLSPLIIPITVSTGDRQFSVKLVADDLAYRTSDDVPELRDASPVIQRFVRWLEKGDHPQRWADAIRANGGGRSCSIAQGEHELWCAVLALVMLFLDWAMRKGILADGEARSAAERYAAWLGFKEPDGPNSGAVDMCQANAFYTFLLAYLRENTSRVVEKPGCTDTVARLHLVNRTTPSLTLPRAVAFRAYAAGRPVPGEVDLQRALTEAGVPFRSEGKDTSWRYAFYARGQAPEGQPEKLPCLSMPLAKLPLEVRSELVKLFGDRFGSLLSQTGEERRAEAEKGGADR